MPSSSSSSSFGLSNKSSFLSYALKRIKGRNLVALQTKSQRLAIEDPQLRNDLVDYLKTELEDGTTSTTTTSTTTTTTTKGKEEAEEAAEEAAVQQDDLQHSKNLSKSANDELAEIDHELEEARETLTKLKSKQEFVGRRLESYERALKNAAASSGTSTTTTTNDDDDDTEETKKKKQLLLLDSYNLKLEPVRKSHAQMMQTIHLLQHGRIANLEKRRQELQTQTDECQAVLETLQRQQELEEKENDEEKENNNEEKEENNEEEKASQAADEATLDEETGRVVVSQQQKQQQHQGEPRKIIIMVKSDKELLSSSSSNPPASTSTEASKKDSDVTVECLASELELTCTTTTTTTTTDKNANNNQEENEEDGTDVFGREDTETGATTTTAVADESDEKVNAAESA